MCEQLQAYLSKFRADAEASVTASPASSAPEAAPDGYKLAPKKKDAEDLGGECTSMPVAETPARSSTNHEARVPFQRSGVRGIGLVRKGHDEQQTQTRWPLAGCSRDNIVVLAPTHCNRPHHEPDLSGGVQKQRPSIPQVEE